jgi:hypothetical protein
VTSILGLVPPEVDDELVSFLGWPPDGAMQVRSRHALENGVFTQSTEKGDLPIREGIHDLSNGEGGIEAEIQLSGQGSGLLVGLQDKPKRPLRSGSVSFPEQGMDKSVPQALMVIVPFSGEGSHEGIVLVLSVVPVVGRPCLVTENLDGKTVDVYGTVPDGMIFSGDP